MGRNYLDDGSLETLKTIESHRRFPYDGTNMLTSKKSLFDDYGASKSQKSVDPQARRLQLEKEFFEAAANLVQKTKALEEIKHDKLYLQVCETWEEYCETVLGRSVGAVRLQFRTFDISEELQNRHKMTTPPLPEKDLREISRLPDSDVKELLDVDLPDLPKKIEAKTKARKKRSVTDPRCIKPKKNDLEPVIIPEDRAQELWEDNLGRLTPYKKDLKVQQALKEWIDLSGIA